MCALWFLYLLLLSFFLLLFPMNPRMRLLSLWVCTLFRLPGIVKVSVFFEFLTHFASFSGSYPVGLSLVLNFPSFYYACWFLVCLLILFFMIFFLLFVFLLLSKFCHLDSFSVTVMFRLFLDAVRFSHKCFVGVCWISSSLFLHFFVRLWLRWCCDRCWSLQVF